MSASTENRPRLPFEEKDFPFWASLWRYFAPARWLILGAIALNIVCGLAITAQNTLPKLLTDSILLTTLSPGEKLQRAALLMGGFLVITLFGRIFFWHMSMRVFSRALNRALASIRTLFFHHVHFLCLRFHQQKQSGELLSYLFGGPVTGLQQFLYQFVLMVPLTIFTLLSTLVLVTSWNPLMAAILFSALALNGWVAYGAMARVKTMNRAYQHLESSVTGRTSELLRGQRAVKMLGAEALVVERFRQDAESIGNKNYEVQVKSHLEHVKSESLQGVWYAVLVIAGTWLYTRNSLTIGELIAILTSYAAIQPMVGTLFQSALALGVAHSGVNRIESVLTHPTSTPTAVEPHREFPREPQITFRDVSFAYEEVSVLRGIDLDIPYGQKVGLVGASGSGKSTVISLLLRLYEPDQGSILLGNIPLQEFEPSFMRKQFGVVPQETFLFHASVRENILLGAPDASEVQVIEALRRANAWEFVEKLPLGLDTLLGENGATLSGGQRQRIGIARALVLDPAIFVFDEATSALDTAAEKVITQTLTGILQNHTALIVAHRLSTIRFCDRIIVFENGKIEQDGTYRELAGKEGIFRELLDAQKEET